MRKKSKEMPSTRGNLEKLAESSLKQAAKTGKEIKEGGRASSSTQRSWERKGILLKNHQKELRNIDLRGVTMKGDYDITCVKKTNTLRVGKGGNYIW